MDQSKAVNTTELHVVAFLKLQGIDYYMEIVDGRVSFKFDDNRTQELIGRFYADHKVPVAQYSDTLKQIRKEMYQFKDRMKGE